MAKDKVRESDREAIRNRAKDHPKHEAYIVWLSFCNAERLAATTAWLDLLDREKELDECLKK